MLFFWFTADDIYSTSENRYKHEAMINGEPVIFEILDTCPKVKPIIIFDSM